MTMPRRFIRAVVGLAGAGLARVALPFCVCAALLAQPLTADATIVLDLNNPTANFTVDPPGSSRWTPGYPLLLTDDSTGDFIAFFGADADAALGMDIDLVASFQVTSNPTSGLDSGVRFIVTDGVAYAAIVCCITKPGGRGLGFAAGGDFSSESNYPDDAFALVDWTLPTSFRLRRTGYQRAELVEINGAPPATPRVLQNLPSRTRPFASVEFGCFSTEAVTTVAVAALETQRLTTGVGDPEPTPSALAMRVATRSPAAAGRLQVEFALRDGSPARLELMDVAGRIVTARQVGTLGPGTHVLDLSEGVTLRSGIYFLRLTQGGGEVRARAAVIR